jgi:hypothetical protein
LPIISNVIGSRRRPLVGILVVVTVLAASLLAAEPAGAATMIARNARWISLRVSARGVALATYYASGRTYRTLVWGATNARAPSRSARQVAFHVNYAGGYGSSLGSAYWRIPAHYNVCRRYTGPRLWHMVVACTAPDGTNWALQAWQPILRDNGWSSTGLHAASGLYVSHWSGPLPKLWFKADWTYAGAPGGPFDQVYGRFTYRGYPVYGFRSTPGGAPLDRWGRLIALDTLNPPWSVGYRQPGGWWRQNSFLSHRPYGDFCAGVYRQVHPLAPRTYPGRGHAYRIIANGPGVTPIVEWQSAPPGYYRPGLANVLPTAFRRGPYRPALDQQLNADLRALDPQPSASSSCYYTH